MLRVYLDACSLQRPLDDRTQPRINMEAEAILSFLSFVEVGVLDWVSSEVLRTELDFMPDPLRRAEAEKFLKLAIETIPLSNTIENLDLQYAQSGIRLFDALHLASASIARVNFFCTSDDKLLKKGVQLAGLKFRVVSPLELLAEILP